jgi:exonuclease III
MASWNAQALFAADPQRQHAKQIQLTLLAANHHVILIQETHATPGTLAVWSPPPGTRFFGSNGSAKQAGVAILASESFLSRFDNIPKEQEHRHWRHLDPGRVAKLKLTGPEGNLDLMVTYLHSGQHKKREGPLPQANDGQHHGQG